MKKITEVYLGISRKVGSSRLRLILFLLAVVLYVLGAGAPEAGGGIINGVTIFKF